MEFIEYPKALYRQGEYSEVGDRVAEEDARANGWSDWQADRDAMDAGAPGDAAPLTARKPVRGKKAE